MIHFLKSNDCKNTVERLLNETNLRVFVYTGQLDLVVNVPGNAHFNENNLKSSLIVKKDSTRKKKFRLFWTTNSFYGKLLLCASGTFFKNYLDKQPETFFTLSFIYF